MKFLLPTLLLTASSALAAPSIIRRSGPLVISDMTGNISDLIDSSTMSFKLTSPNYPNDTPTDCNLIWSANGVPKETARCNNGKYTIKFPDGTNRLTHFTIELERVDGEVEEKGQASFSYDAPGTKWVCLENPEYGVTRRCRLEGVREVRID